MSDSSQKISGLCLCSALIFGIFMGILSKPFWPVVMPENCFENGELIGIESLGRLRHDWFSTISYELMFDKDMELVFEFGALDFLFGKSTVITTRKQKQTNTYTIEQVQIGNQSYDKKSLDNFPKILAEAEMVLQLGRDKFAQAQQKLVNKGN